LIPVFGIGMDRQPRTVEEGRGQSNRKNLHVDARERAGGVSRCYKFLVKS